MAWATLMSITAPKVNWMTCKLGAEGQPGEESDSLAEVADDLSQHHRQEQENDEQKAPQNGTFHYCRLPLSVPASGAKAPGAPGGLVQGVRFLHGEQQHGMEYQLGNALPGLDGVGL